MRGVETLPAGRRAGDPAPPRVRAAATLISTRRGLRRKRPMNGMRIAPGALALVLLAQALFEGGHAIDKARASDAPLQHALKEAECMLPTIRQVWQRGEVTAYEANCLASSRRILTIVCDKRVCRVDDPEPEEDLQ